MRPRDLWQLLKDAVLECGENKAQRLAAALAYYTMCSLAPLLIVIIAIIRLTSYQVAATERLLLHLQQLMGSVEFEALKILIGNLDTPGSDVITTIIGSAGLLFIGSSMFNHLRDSLNTIWEVRLRPGQAVRGYFFSRALAIATLLCIGVTTLVGVSLSIGLEDMVRALAGTSDHLAWALLRGAQLLLSIGLLSVMVALTYKLLPDTSMAWRDIWIGALLTALLIALGQALIAMYLRSSHVGSAYSIVGAVVVILVWVYYSALIFFFGAELTWLYANRYGSRIVPAPYALSLSAGDRAAQGLLRTSELEAVAQRQETEA